MSPLKFLVGVPLPRTQRIITNFDTGAQGNGLMGCQFHAPVPIQHMTSDSPQRSFCIRVQACLPSIIESLEAT